MAKSELREVNPCECTHGLERHSEKPVKFRDRDGKDRVGRICLLSTCGCTRFRKQQPKNKSDKKNFKQLQQKLAARKGARK